MSKPEKTKGSQGTLKLQILLLNQIIPYENNPRNNDNAVNSVIESIKQCGYIAPIIVDENGIILAGHTRYKALKKMGRENAEVIVKAGLTEEQKRKYRLLDNKTGELATWDYDLLSLELEGLDFGNLNLEWGIDDPAPKAAEETIYTEKTDIPHYEITGQNVQLSQCIDKEKYASLIADIDVANVTEDEKSFLKAAATRHYGFCYKQIAEYYAKATAEMQDLMEQSALVIIDYDSAIKNGYVKLTHALREMENEN